MKVFALLAILIGTAAGQSLRCDLQSYKPLDGLKADHGARGLTVTWTGERSSELRAVFIIRDGQPLIHELAVRKSGGAWAVLGRDLIPEFDVVSGRRRVSQQQLNPLQALKVAMTPEVFDRERWNAFWDAPLDIPGNKAGSPEWPRKLSSSRPEATSQTRAIPSTPPVTTRVPPQP